ncbi:protein FAM98B isoform X1 [Anabas testudineus]|uniref:Family with sequence similarity 98 member B n=1 Tax=Anabas testudineus TaxID=64144 RepID=A0A3Q1ID51_ANATE|nr:protein FAM98B isoform X1 [Anabas testudineus]
MERSRGTVSAIRALGYPGGSCVARCKCDELPCPLLSWLCAELRGLCPELEDSGRTGDILLVGELRKLLSNLSSPLSVLTSEVLGPDVLNRVTEFLVSELQAARIIKHKESRPEEKTTEEESEKEQRVEDPSHELAETCEEYGDNDCTSKAEMQAEWVLTLHALDMDTSSKFTDVLSEVESRLAQIQCRSMTEPLLSTSLSSDQWMKVKEINRILSKDYECRRQMMIKRFQVTLESFEWGEKKKEHSEALASVPPLTSLADSPRVSLSLLLAAREDQSFIQPIKAGRSTQVYKMLMGNVPDRGGRPGEIEPPMPAWDHQRAKGNRFGRGSGHQRRKFSDKKKKGKKE